MRLIYLAHPVAGDVVRNLSRARDWVRKLTEAFDDVAIVATWIIECSIWDDADPEQRALGFRRNLAIIPRCDEIWLCGDVVSPGMQIELAHAAYHGLPAYSFVCDNWHQRMEIDDGSRHARIPR